MCLRDAFEQLPLPAQLASVTFFDLPTHQLKKKLKNEDNNEFRTRAGTKLKHQPQYYLPTNLFLVSDFHSSCPSAPEGV